jgi:diguanylate cyclase (GGDEF)-like protein
VVLYLLTIAVLNIGLGFALAIYLAVRWRMLVAARQWAMLAANTLEIAGMDQAAGPQEGESAPVVPPAARTKSDSELAIEGFQQQVQNYATRLGDADERLRQYVAAPEVAGIEACLNHLDATTRQYADNRDAAHRQFTDLTVGKESWEGLSNDLLVAAQLQDAEIKRVRQEIANFDFQSDLSDGCRRLIGRTHRVIGANNLLRDTLDRAMAGLAVEEDRAPEAPERNDALTGCVNRSALEADLAAWWGSDSEHRGRLGMAVIDMDRFAEINERCGCRAGDAILRAVGRLLGAQQQGNVTAARFAGQKFVLLFADVQLSEATAIVEGLRQTIERATFEHAGGDIRLTVSCGLTQTMPDDTTDSVLQRAEAALGEAKRYGRNRTFVHESRFPTPVVPSELLVEEKRITL